MEELLKLFGLKPDATEDDAVAALKALQKKAQDAEQAVAAVKADLEKKDQAIAAAKAETPASATDAMQEMQAELAALKADLRDKEVADLIDVALTDGKLLTAQEQWARELGKTDLAALKRYLDTTQPIAALKGLQTGGKAPGSDGASNAEIAGRARAYKDKLAAKGQIVTMGAAVDAVTQGADQ